MNFLTEIFTARYEPNKNKICGCRKNSFAYLHELRHKQQINNKTINIILNFNHITAYSCSFFWLFFGIINLQLFHKCLMIIGLHFTPYVFCLFFLEVDAWIYSITNYIKYKNKNN